MLQLQPLSGGLAKKGELVGRSGVMFQAIQYKASVA
jgi:hypothetical protein